MAVAGIFQNRVRRRIGDAQIGAEPESRAVYRGHALGCEQFGDEILIRLDHLARWRALADRLGAGGIDVEGALPASGISDISSD